MTYLSEQLPEMNEEISSKKFPRVALGSLPESYNNFLMNYDSGAERLQLSLAKCRRSLFQSRANTGQPNHMRLCTVMYVVQCKWNQKVVVDTCLPSQINFYRYMTAYFIKSKSEVLSKFMEYVNSVNNWIILVITLQNWTFCQSKMLRNHHAS